MSLIDTANIDVKTIIALNVHEVKNLMALLMFKLDEVQSTEQAIADSRLLCHRVNDCMERMLLLFNLESERLRPNIADYSPADFVDEFVRNAQVLAGSRIKIVKAVEQAPSYWFFDRDLVEMAMMNAIHNALRFARHEIKISAYVANQMLVLEVTDDGAGYAEDLLADPVTAIMQTSQGLGLYLANAIAQLHVNKDRQGQLLLHNNEHPRGAVFSLQLP
ncbi:MAG: HAMP domain-containing sensor histidine kinase [Sulfuriferula sp.]